MAGDIRYPVRGRILASSSADRTAPGPVGVQPSAATTRSSILRREPSSVYVLTSRRSGPGSRTTSRDAEAPGGSARSGAVTPPSASDAATDRRTVGDILLARGYITRDAARGRSVASQHETGKPLGQVLVEAGAITRLELASALAEQWSDTATWLGPPAECEAAGAASAAVAYGERRGLRRGARGRATRSSCRRRSSSSRGVSRSSSRSSPSSGCASRAARSRAPSRLLDRVEVVQDGVTVLSRRIDELTEGTERALGEDRAELDRADRRARRAQGAVEHTANASDDRGADRKDRAPTDTAPIEELRAAIDELAARPAGDPELAGAVGALTGRLDVARREDRHPRRSRDRRRAARDRRRPRREPGAARRERIPRELRSEVAELAARPQADPGLAAQLEELTGGSRLSRAPTPWKRCVRRWRRWPGGRPPTPRSRPGSTSSRARVDGLASGLRGAARAHRALATLQEALDELSGRVASLAETQALDDLRASLDEVSARPAIAPELLDQLSELAARIEALADEPDTVDDAAFEAMREQIAGLASRSAADPSSSSESTTWSVGSTPCTHASKKLPRR